MELEELQAGYQDVQELLKVLPPTLPSHRPELQRLRDTLREIGGRLNDFSVLIERWVWEDFSPNWPLPQPDTGLTRGGRPT